MRHLSIPSLAFSVFLVAQPGFSQDQKAESPVPSGQVVPPPSANIRESAIYKSDVYRAVVVFNADNPTEADEGLKAISASIGAKTRTLNLSVEKIDAADKAAIDGKTAEVLKLLAPEKFPFTVVYYPAEAEVESPLWMGNMTPEDVAALSDSPARREIARRLLKGESIVWLLIDSGVDYKDYRILKLLTDVIQKSSTGPANPASQLSQEAQGKEGETRPATTVKMSIIRVSREDADEKILLNMLGGLEPEMMNVSNEPVLVPICGRGRVSKILSDEEIDRENIDATIESVSGGGGGIRGAKSGTALLMSVNWDAFADGKLSIDKELPALKVFSSSFSLDDIYKDDTSASVPAVTPAVGDKALEAAPPVPMRIINIILVSVIGTLIVLFFAVILKARR